MMKMKLVTSIIFILIAVGAASAAEVINVDIKGYGSETPYVGNGAYDVGDDTEWTVYYGGWGMPVGSARSEGLQTSSQGWYCGVYAAQVWLGDTGEDHSFQWGSGLMDDGFVADIGNEPNLAIFGDGGFQGIYDIYVYGNDAGSFKLGYYGIVTEKTVTGGVAAGTFVEGGNYVVFQDVDVNDPYSGSIYIAYTAKLNGLQFVKKKEPVSVGNGTTIPAASWDVAGERNVQSDDPQGYGLDTFGGSVGFLESEEFMAYDITVDDANKGQYQIGLDVNTAGQYRLTKMNMYLDDRYLGDVNYLVVDPVAGKTTVVTTNLFAGNHTVKWRFPPNTDWGFNIVDVNFVRVGDAVMNNCDDVSKYGLFYDADITTTDVSLTPNCAVNIYDLDAMVSNWLKSQ